MNTDSTSQKFPEFPKSDDDNAQLSDAQLLALDMLLTGATFCAVARALNIDRRTLYNWRHHDPDFGAALARRRQDLFDSAADRFRNTLTSALDTLEKQTKDPYTPTSHRAAKTILSLSQLHKFLNPPIPEAR